MTSEVLLGVAGDLVDLADVTQWATKAGGWPCVPWDVPAAAVAAATVCKVCGKQRSLLVQVW